MIGGRGGFRLYPVLGYNAKLGAGMNLVLGAGPCAGGSTGSGSFGAESNCGAVLDSDGFGVGTTPATNRSDEIEVTGDARMLLRPTLRIRSRRLPTCLPSKKTAAP